MLLLSFPESYQKLVGKVLVGAFYEVTLLTGGDDLCVFAMHFSLIAVRRGPGSEMVLNNLIVTPCGRASSERFNCLLTREPYTGIISYTVVGTYLLYSCWIKAFERPYVVL